MTFSPSVSLVDLQGHWIKGSKFAFVHSLERKMILSDTEGSRAKTLDGVSMRRSAEIKEVSLASAV